MTERVQIERVVVKKFRSIQHTDVQITEPLTYIVGPNGSGKTNFFNALGFIRNGLSNSLDNAVKDAGGVLNIVPAPAEWPSIAEFLIVWRTSTDYRGSYEVRIQFESARTFSVAREECTTTSPDGQTSSFTVHLGQATGTPDMLPAGAPDRLYLVSASGLPEFRTAYESLAGIERSEPVPAPLRTLNFGKRADYEGFANRISRLKDEYPDRLQTVEDYLKAVLPTFNRFEVGFLNNDLPYLMFRENTSAERSAGFSIRNMSSGSVHLADLLITLFSPPESSGPYLPWLIEEPETGLHPGALRVLRDAFIEASHFRQMLISTHSPEFLDDSRLSERNLLAAFRGEHGSYISNLDPGTQQILRKRLYTAGELLRQGLLDSTEAHAVTDHPK